MKLKKLAAQTAMAGALGAAALGLGAGLAQADPHGPPGPPWIPGPGVNAGAPGNPLPPGQGYLPPPGHRGDIDDVHPGLGPAAVLGAVAAGGVERGHPRLGCLVERRLHPTLIRT